MERDILSPEEILALLKPIPEEEHTLYPGFTGKYLKMQLFTFLTDIEFFNDQNSIALGHFIPLKFNKNLQEQLKKITGKKSLPFIASNEVMMIEGIFLKKEKQLGLKIKKFCLLSPQA